MKHEDSSLGELLVMESAALGIRIDPSQATLLVRQLTLVLEANVRLNLTRIDNPVEAVYMHIIDSLLALPELTDSPVGEMVDLGTGGGFPGVPLAIVSGRNATLLESVSKKSRAVNEILERLGLHDQIRCVPARAEAFSVDHSAASAAVTARAVAALPSLVELAAPLLTANGRLICLKGLPSDAEIEAGDRAASIAGLFRLSSRRAELPGERGIRTIVVYEKTGNPAIALPRRVGLAQHSPLG